MWEQRLLNLQENENVSKNNYKTTKNHIGFKCILLQFDQKVKKRNTSEVPYRIFFGTRSI